MKKLLALLLFVPLTVVAYPYDLTITWDEYIDSNYPANTMEHKYNCTLNGDPYIIPNQPITDLIYVGQLDAVPGDVLTCTFQAYQPSTTDISDPTLPVTEIVPNYPGSPKGHKINMKKVK